jgi:hypothetical protein
MANSTPRPVISAEVVRSFWLEKTVVEQLGPVAMLLLWRLFYGLPERNRAGRDNDDTPALSHSKI